MSRRDVNTLNVLSHETNTRGYEEWGGSNFFCLEGRIIGGPEWQKLVQTSATITIASIIFIADPAYKHYRDRNWWWVILVGLLGYVISFTFLLLTAFTDPGILPRPDAETKKWRGMNRPKPASSQMVNISGRMIELKWCPTCQIYRPPRASHCRTCDNCVEKWDHHCPWIGNCVGLRNYIFYNLFLWTLWFHCFFVWCLCIIAIVKDAQSKKGSTTEKFRYGCEKNIISCLLVLFVFTVLYGLGSLCGYHVFLFTTNETTGENLKKAKRAEQGLDPENSPYALPGNTNDRGCYGNVGDICTAPAESHVHTHHIAPALKANQRYVGKRVVTYLDADEVISKYVSTMHRKKKKDLEIIKYLSETTTNGPAEHYVIESIL